MRHPLLIAVAAVFSLAACDQERRQIHIVGSSTVYPFVTIAAEEFGREGKFKTPIVEATGTGGGLKLFCSGAGPKTPDIANASRPIKESEKKLCAKNGVKNPLEVKIGYDGIIIANAKNAPALKVSKAQLFLALAKEVPQHGKLVLNPYQRWNEIDPTLPNARIEMYGPPPTSGTRDSFAELVMEEACKHFPEFTAAYPKEEERKKLCQLVREDGRYLEAGENDNILVEKLVHNTDAFAIFGYSFLEENADKVKAAAIDGKVPNFENIVGGSYTVARSLHVYAKREHFGKIPGIKEFLQELTSETAMGEEGYLTLKGLIPLRPEERSKMAKAVR